MPVRDIVRERYRSRAIQIFAIEFSCPEEGVANCLLYNDMSPTVRVYCGMHMLLCHTHRDSPIHKGRTRSTTEGISFAAKHRKCVEVTAQQWPFSFQRSEHLVTFSVVWLTDLIGYAVTPKSRYEFNSFERDSCSFYWMAIVVNMLTACNVSLSVFSTTPPPPVQFNCAEGNELTNEPKKKIKKKNHRCHSLPLDDVHCQSFQLRWHEYSPTKPMR